MISDMQFDVNRSICGNLVNKYDMMLVDSRTVESDDPQEELLPSLVLLDEQERERLRGMEEKEVKATSAPLFMKKKDRKTKPYRQVRQSAQKSLSWQPGRGQSNIDGRGHHSGLLCLPDNTRTPKKHNGSKRRDDDRQTFFVNSIFWNKRKSVTFPAEKGLLERYQEAASDCYCSTVCVSDLWYQPEDFARFRCSAQLEASVLCLAEETHQCLYFLEQSISIAARLAEEVCKYRKRGHNEAALWDRIFQRVDIRHTGVTHWSLQSSYRGLECLASKPLRRAKYSTRKHMVRELSRQQQCYNHHPRHTATETRKRRSLSPQELAAKLEQQSQFSRLFAHMLGIADELSAGQVYENQE